MLLEALESEINQDVRRALKEDLAPQGALSSASGGQRLGQGDITAGLVPADQVSKASVFSREPAILCGRNWFDAVFRQLDETIRILWYAADGQAIAPHQVVCTLEGPARAILSGERTALNFLQTLSGTATIAGKYAGQVKGLKTKILDTRKTIPGLRHAQKYAVRCGGCHNHRMGLYDAFLIKENHITAAGSIAAAISSARSMKKDLPVEVEVEDLDELQQALNAGADRILLDNFKPGQIREAVKLTQNQAELEASGGITLDDLRKYAETGVDYISTGALTKDLRAIDLSMRFD